METETRRDAFGSGEALQTAIYDAPRTVSASPRFWRASAFLLILTGVGAGVSHWLGDQAETRLDRLLNHGVAVEATVRSKEVTRGERPKYFVLYDFELRGRRWTGKDHLPVMRWDRYDVGRRVPVTAWSDDPSVNRIGVPTPNELAETVRNSWMRTGGIALLGLLGWGVLCLSLQSQIRILRNGIVAVDS